MPIPHGFVVTPTTFPLHPEFRSAGTTPGKSRAQHISRLADMA